MNSSSRVHPLFWAIFLGASWTWCIGMYLPVLLVRDYGLWGWIVFAIPNVLGAAAMGWVVRDAERSRQLIASHRLGGAAFSIVTIAFQAYFGAWYFSRLFGSKGSANWLGIGFLIPVTFVFAAILLMKQGDESSSSSPPPPERPALLLGVLTWIISFACLAIFLLAAPIAIPFAAEEPHTGLAALAAVCVFGFALCPYLDLTFHEARQRTSPAGGRAAFGFGFGLFFAVMIVFTLLYARTGVLETLAIGAVATHILLQLAFTIAVHLEQLQKFARTTLTATFVVMGLMLPLGCYAGETAYRLFMGFYGLVFPAYVWLCMIPTWREPVRPSRRSLGVFAAAVLIASPFYWMGFIEQRMFWILPGLAIVLLARLLVSAQRAVPPSPSAA